MIISRKKYDAIIKDYESRLDAQKDDFQSRLDALSTDIANVTEEKQNLLDKYGQIIDIEAEHDRIRKNFEYESKVHEIHINEIKEKEQSLEAEYKTAIGTYDELKKTINLYDTKIDLMEFGIYDPIYSYSTPEEFKSAITEVQYKQKELISNKQAAVCNTQWTVDGSKAKGTSMTNKEIKLVLRAFNGECDAIISKVRWNNVGRCKNRIQDIYDKLNKLESSNLVTITEDYLRLKLEELDLYYGLANLTYSIKEQERALREERKEEEKAQREIEQERIRAEKEELHYQTALEKVKAEIENSTGVRYEQLAEKIKYYEEELAEARANKERAISMAQQTRRGYVYIISNIGSFGENIYKIGMTRRLDPEDRIRELSNASVPFKFDIHAMIYSEDAPSLESMLHNAFDEQKVNLVNGHKEFFKVTLDEIQKKIEESGISAQFIKIAEARDYRESERIRNKEIFIEDAVKEFPDNLFNIDIDDE